MIRLLYFASLLLFCLFAFSQNDSTSIPSKDSILYRDASFSMSLEELMNMKVYTASRKDESFFKTPISSCLITHNDIVQHGMLSIPEALRLCPAIMVREISNGNYDVSIRDIAYGLPRYQTSINTKTLLVMIDNRIVFSFFEGGIFWQNLPIEINDVERIEVAYGPNASLYGPNAMAGVINIISKKHNKEKQTSAFSTFQGGNNTNMGSVHIGQSIGKNLSIDFGISNSSRQRYESTFFDDTKDVFVNNASELSNPRIANRAANYFPEPGMSLKKTMAYANLNYSKNDSLLINFSFGYNKNGFLNQYYTGTTMTPFSSDSYFGYLQGRFHNFSFQLSRLSGRQNILGSFDNYNHDFQNSDVYLDYNFKLLKILNIKPGLTFNAAVIDDRKYTLDKNQLGAFNNRAQIENYAAFVKSEIENKGFRLIGSFRLDAFNINTQINPSFNLIANYFPAENHQLRACIGRSHSSAFVIPSFVNISLAGGTRTNTGNKNLENTTINSFVIGYKSIIGKKLNIDIAVFRNEMTNFKASIKDTLFFNQTGPNLILRFANLPDFCIQHGATFAANSLLFENRVNVKAHFTIQNSQLNNTSEYQNQPKSNPEKNIFKTRNIKHEGSPDFWGGLFVHARLSKKISLSVDSYFFDRHRLTSTFQTSQQLMQTDPELPREYSINNISGKIIFNSKLAFSLSKNLEVFLNLY